MRIPPNSVPIFITFTSYDAPFTNLLAIKNKAVKGIPRIMNSTAIIGIANTNKIRISDQRLSAGMKGNALNMPNAGSPIVLR